MIRDREHGALTTWLSALVVGVVVGVVAFAGVSTLAAPAAHADTSTAQTVTAASQDKDAANAPAPELAVTVSQTKDLTSQGIVVSWTGGKQSTRPSQQTGGENFLQIMQCGGDDPANPGQPDRTTCQFGAFLSPGATRDQDRVDGSIASEDAAYSTARSGPFVPAYTSIPFRSATGATVTNVVDGKKVPSVDVNTNQFFTQYTSNEVPWAGSGADGSGSINFEVQTSVQSPGLGCGAQIKASGAEVVGQSCWLVVIPRGTADSGNPSITGSGLFWDAWKHRIAVRLDFRPVGVNCSLSSVERQLSGSELIATAVASWQPSLCGARDGDAYTLITGAESDAAFAANSTIPGPLALTSRALRTADTGATDNLQYAPVGLTAVSVSFAIDRDPKADPSTPADALQRAHLPFTSMNLTPRLVAKLLTGSYLDALPYQADRSHLSHQADAKTVYNPRNLLMDPDFLAINDKEWGYQAISSPSVADLIVPSGRSDAAYALWSYVMADQDARDFLAGTPDPYGMTVNPWSSTDSAINKNGVGIALPRDDFPKADPTEQPAVEGGQAAVNVVTWRPYSADLDTSGYLTLRGDGQILGGWDPISQPPKYSKTTRELVGSRHVIAVTDAAAASKYQVVTASLKNAAGQFVAATTDSMAAAAAAMTTVAAQPQVYTLDNASDPAKSAASAYPLTMPVYAAVNPRMTDAALRASYAAFIRFAAGDGQASGSAVGQLPAGYAPIPQGWKAQALAAAAVIQSGVVPASSTPAPAGTVTSQPAGSGSASTVSAPYIPAAANASGGGTTPDSPAARGAVAGALSGGTTPADAENAPMQFAAPISVAAGAASALAVFLMPRLRRRL